MSVVDRAQIDFRFSVPLPRCTSIYLHFIDLDRVCPSKRLHDGPIEMASKRLIKELDAYSREPSFAIVSLEPVSDDNISQLKAVLRGPNETAYEGM